LGEFVENVVLVYGPRKSGTTLLHNLLDGGRDILVIPDELKLKFILEKILKSPFEKKRFFFSKGRSLFRNLEVAESSGQWRIDMKGPFRIGNISSQDLSRKFDAKKYVESLNTTANDPNIEDLRGFYIGDLLAFENAVKEDGNYRYWASKEVGGDPESITIHLKSVFPHAKFIYIARDPNLIVRSILLKEKRKGNTLTVMRILKECLQAQSVMGYYEKLGKSPDQVLVFYEDLVRDTPREMHRIADFLQIPYDEIFERPSLFGVGVKVGTSSKNTKAVFLEKKDWKEGLSLREKMAVMLFHFSYRFYKKVVGGNTGDYQTLRKMAASIP
jgi:hypothetical protein